ncbi:hypothetical protein E2C01_034029 [Portunus trituberculatus]|uniref:Uncharacterized protein n=1 Tax=Portunus trituberculatus TaxID=210409 RepID=A0A5B7F0D7_PORTR|nr:hypothetical protein [Portunus trituberculatus]
MGTIRSNGIGVNDVVGDGGGGGGKEVVRGLRRWYVEERRTDSGSSRTDQTDKKIKQQACLSSLYTAHTDKARVFMWLTCTVAASVLGASLALGGCCQACTPIR